MYQSWIFKLCLILLALFLAACDTFEFSTSLNDFSLHSTSTTVTHTGSTLAVAAAPESLTPPALTEDPSITLDETEKEATITFKTDKDAYLDLYYSTNISLTSGSGGTYAKSNTTDNYQKNHTVSLSNLQLGKHYFYYAVLMDESGNKRNTQIYHFIMEETYVTSNQSSYFTTVPLGSHNDYPIKHTSTDLIEGGLQDDYSNHSYTAYNGTNFGIAWVEHINPSTGIYDPLYFQVIDGTGAFVNEPILLTEKYEAEKGHISIAAGASNWLVAWVQKVDWDTEIMGVLVASDGSAIESSFPVTNNFYDDYQPMALYAGDYYAVFYSQANMGQIKHLYTSFTTAGATQTSELDLADAGFTTPLLATNTMLPWTALWDTANTRFLILAEADDDAFYAMNFNPTVPDITDQTSTTLAINTDPVRVVTDGAFSYYLGYVFHAGAGNHEIRVAKLDASYALVGSHQILVNTSIGDKLYYPFLDYHATNDTLLLTFAYYNQWTKKHYPCFLEAGSDLALIQDFPTYYLSEYPGTEYPYSSYGFYLDDTPVYFGLTSIQGTDTLVMLK